ncbi:pyroglutamyl peptidase [Demetria terragena]|uniref:pyroglutamyl peptidase n=1 Tax=Demetria terragena TaxID=63959 RepID=UPI0012EAF4A9|nr:pyroglutamyl peptidase [Demetria terragena]
MSTRTGRPIVLLSTAALALSVGVSSPATADRNRPQLSPESGVMIGACLSTSNLPYEEDFLHKPQAGEFIRQGGFEPLLTRFAAKLCREKSGSSAQHLVERTSRVLWRTAVDRAQGRVEMGTLSAGDDRPLYWTRLSMVAALRQWSPSSHVKSGQRQRLIDTVDRISRGQDDIKFSGSKRTKRVLVTGFDPFTLNRDVRQGNPSGASALALDGQTIQTKAGPARVETAAFPVRWRDFEKGMVEQALLPHFRPGRRQVDAFATTSQGREGIFDLEQSNGAWRGGYNDNEDVCYRGIVPIPKKTPTVRPQPQWVPTTLPTGKMTAADTGAFPVNHNTEVVEVPGTTPPEPVTTACPAGASPGTTRPDGPTAGSQARSGGGGDYLSNEIAYRATLLRDAVKLRVPGGHIHTPVLSGLATDQNELTSPAFETNRTSINDQVRSLLRVGVGTLGQSDRG